MNLCVIVSIACAATVLVVVAEELCIDAVCSGSVEDMPHGTQVMPNCNECYLSGFR
jgi:hypothetical protein